MTKRDSNRNDLTKEYLQDIRRRPLLSAEDEVMLAKQIEEGLYAQEALSQPRSRGKNRKATTTAQAAELQRLAAQGVEAKRVFIESNLRLVLNMANKYTGRGLSQADLMQEGTIGLMRAVEKYDYTKGFRFSTYATWWIRQAITRAMADQSRTIRVPVHMVEMLNKLSKAQRDMYQRDGQEPSTDELAAELGVPVERVVEMQQYGLSTISLHAPVGDEEGLEFGDMLEDTDALSPFDVASSSLLRQQLGEILGTLSPQERLVVEMRFGLVGGKEASLADVGAVCTLSRERIRQIESKTMAKLRHPARSQGLMEYL